MSNAPLFILAPPRSFTSVICASIGQHPNLYGLPEVNLFAAQVCHDLRRLYGIRPGFQHGLLRAVAELGLGEQTEETIKAAETYLREHGSLSTAAMFQDLAAWATPRRLVDKSPVYVFNPGALERIRDAFPNAYYLHLMRHPTATCDSIFRLRDSIQSGAKEMPGFKPRKRMGRRQEPSGRFSDPEVLWLKPHLHILDFLESIPADHQMFYRGEDLMADPDRYFREIAEWLGIRTDDEAIEATRHPERSPFACYGPPNAEFGNDPNFLESPALRGYKVKELSLDTPLESRPDICLSEPVKEYARIFGYP